MSSSFVPPPPATAEVGEEKGSERNRRTLLAWPSPKLASGSLGLRDVCSWLPLRSVLSQVLWRHLWLNATVTWGIHPASPAVTNLVFPAFLVVHCIHGLHGSRYGIKLILSTVGPTSAQSFAWASTRIDLPRAAGQQRGSMSVIACPVRIVPDKETRPPCLSQSAPVAIETVPRLRQHPPLPLTGNQSFRGWIFCPFRGTKNLGEKKEKLMTPFYV